MIEKQQDSKRATRIAAQIGFLTGFILIMVGLAVFDGGVAKLVVVIFGLLIAGIVGFTSQKALLR